MIERHGRLTLVSMLTDKTADGHIKALWKCDCGTEIAVARSRVRNGYTQSCGCLILETKTNLRHGGKGTREYSSWAAMRARCLNPKSKDYPRYGALGVTVHPAFDDFATFLAEVGPRPVNTTLDRIDGARGYEPGNVRWATPTEQAENTRQTWVVQIGGERFASVHDAARHFGVSGTTIVRWCDGYTDARRQGQPSGGRIPPRPDCQKWKRYAA